MCSLCFPISRRGFIKSGVSVAALALAGNRSMAEDLNFPGAIPRDQWSLVAPEASPGSIEQYARSGKPKFVSIHYTAFFAQHPKFSTRELIRNLQTGHIKDSGYGDIAYHYIVTLPGEIYEGRPLDVAPASGTYYHSETELADAQYQSDGRLVPNSVVAGSAPGNSEGHITVSFNVGRGNPKILPDEVMEQGAKLVAKLLFDHGLTPDDVRAHREFANSKCPGDLIYAWLRGSTMRRDGVGTGLTSIRQEYERLTNA